MLADRPDSSPAAGAEAPPSSLTPQPPRSLLTRSGGAGSATAQHSNPGISFGKADSRPAGSIMGGSNNSNSNTAAATTHSTKRFLSSAAPVPAHAAAPPRESSTTPSEADATAAAAASAPMDRVLQTGQPAFSTQLDFLTVNRTVAALERAVERLELLSLLDASGPVDDAAAQPGGTEGGEKGSLARTHNANAAAASTRGAAVLLGESRNATMATAQRVGEVIVASQQQGSRGRPSVLELLAEQRQLERRYGELLMQTQPVVSLHPGEPQLRKECFANVQDATQAALQRELAQVSARLRDTNRLLSTQLQDNPQDADNWAKVSNERKELTALLKDVVAELTTGYREVFQYQQQQRGRKSDPSQSRHNNNEASTAPGNGETSQRLGSTVDSAAAHGSGAGNSTVARSSSRRSSANGGGGGGASSEAESQQTALKRFGSTVQRRRASRGGQQAPRIPLSASYHHFAVKILQEEAAQRWADGVLAKERALNQNVKQLQADLVRERELKERDVAERRARVSTLQLELRKLKTAMQQRTEAAKARGEAATEALQRDGAAEISEVRRTAQASERLLAVEANTHSAFTEYLRRRTEATDTLASEWEAKAQRELKKKEAAKIDAEGSRQSCAQRLADLEQEQAVQLELQKAREEKAAAEEEERQRVEDQRAAEYAAASVLEAALKAMMTRQTLAKLKKGSKKKK